MHAPASIRFPGDIVPGTHTNATATFSVTDSTCTNTIGEVASDAIENRGVQRSDSRRSLSGAWGAEPPSRSSRSTCLEAITASTEQDCTLKRKDCPSNETDVSWKLSRSPADGASSPSISTRCPADLTSSSANQRGDPSSGLDCFVVRTDRRFHTTSCSSRRTSCSSRKNGRSGKHDGMLVALRRPFIRSD